ncbi:ArnT family glycosyltransferase [Dermatobacter hominis]|uniref:ArnT family glycosyltransferase n=1 Tax=Dermatobacter hominis TaxID=2884263 RepID=UPI001D102812|nr:glycosyltransferase family 39 protein [Dermatobacter hominis]UDY37867.1 glycosyltransferase family 39 protein [Dermatobacter hominis]
MTTIDDTAARLAAPPLGGIPAPPGPEAGAPPTPPADATAGRPSRWHRLWRGRPADPSWYRPLLWALLAVTAVAYLWDLGASGWANSYYSAAVQAGSQSWKAWFFGSFDASNSITVDKAPAALWVMGLSARVFGVSAWSILVPQALMGVGSVALVVATVKRWFRPGAALLAGLVFAATPVAALMFRFNNPDALLVLLLCAAAAAVTRAIEGGRAGATTAEADADVEAAADAEAAEAAEDVRATGSGWRWLVLAGGLVGFAFLAKMLQAFVVLPAFALAYLVAAPTTFWRRVRDLAAMGAATIVGAGWWVAVVELWPASSRPYIGGSQTNSVLELVFGYNGLGRLTGDETGSVGGAGGAGGAGGNWGPTGILRMFNEAFGGQASWLLPAALLLLLAGLVWTSRRPRTDRSRAALILWGGWLVITGVVFSLGQGIIHEYYTVALAPAIGAVVGIGASLAWDRRHSLVTRVVMAGVVAATAAWTAALLGRTTGWNAWLTPAVVATSVVAVVLLLLGDRVRRGAVTATAVGALLAVGAGLAAPIAASATTIATPHSGSIVTAGPAMGSGGPGGLRGGPGGMPAFGGQGGPPAFGGQGGPPAFGGQGGPPALGGQGGTPVFGGQGGTTTQGASPPAGTSPQGAGGRQGGMGGLLDATTPTDATVAALQAGASGFDWVLATVGSNNAAGYQLASGEAVMAIGGFNGSDPSPTLEEFQEVVADGRVHWFVAGGVGGGAMGGSDVGAEISSWVRSNFASVEVGDVTMYDLTAPTS